MFGQPNLNVDALGFALGALRGGTENAQPVDIDVLLDAAKKVADFLKKGIPENEDEIADLHQRFAGATNV